MLKTVLRDLNFRVVDYEVVNIVVIYYVHHRLCLLVNIFGLLTLFRHFVSSLICATLGSSACG